MPGGGGEIELEYSNAIWCAVAFECLRYEAVEEFPESIFDSS